MSDIFVSYARPDQPRVVRLAEALRSEGWSVWWDRTIPSGKSFSKVIQDALNEAQCVIVVWSKHSVDSDWVQEEAEEGKKRGILVPVCLDKVEPPIGFRRIQAALLDRWKGQISDPAFSKLINDISLIVRPKPRPVSQGTPAPTVSGRSDRLAEAAKKKSDSVPAMTNAKVRSRELQQPGPWSPLIGFLKKLAMGIVVGAVGGLLWGVVGGLMEWGGRDGWLFHSLSGWVPQTTAIGAAAGIVLGLLSHNVKTKHDKT